MRLRKVHLNSKHWFTVCLFKDTKGSCSSEGYDEKIPSLQNSSKISLKMEVFVKAFELVHEGVSFDITTNQHCEVLLGCSDRGLGNLM